MLTPVQRVSQEFLPFICIMLRGKPKYSALLFILVYFAMWWWKNFKASLIGNLWPMLAYYSFIVASTSVGYNCSLYLVISFRASPVSEIVDPCSSWSPSFSFALQSSFYCSQQRIIMHTDVVFLIMKPT